MRLALRVIDYVEVKNLTTKVQLLQLVAKCEEKHGGRGTQGPMNNVGGKDWDSRMRLPDRLREGNWREASVVNRQNDMRMMNVDSNGFKNHGGI
ncbi:hypothetical protein TNCV_456941 [Trichonephila clavipes]|nr:hypothetical protein TNCV_456941 [Trichonephila clavipes]